jgi:hypothetical protein
MLSLLIFVITLLLLFWLISLVWSQKIAKRIFKVFFYVGLLVGILMASYVLYQSYRWGAVLHQANEHGLDITKVITAAPSGGNTN